MDNNHDNEITSSWELHKRMIEQLFRKEMTTNQRMGEFYHADERLGYTILTDEDLKNLPKENGLIINDAETGCVVVSGINSWDVRRY